MGKASRFSDGGASVLVVTRGRDDSRSADAEPHAAANTNSTTSNFFIGGHGMPSAAQKRANQIAKANKPSQQALNQAGLYFGASGIQQFGGPTAGAPADSGGSSGGGGGGFVPPPPSIDTDPGWLEFNRQTDLSIAQQQADLQRRRGLVESARDRTLADLEPAGEQAREGIMGGLEARGLYGGGQMEQGLARQRAAQASRAGAIQAGAAGQIGDLESDVAMRIAELNAQRAIQRASMASVYG